jgi:hypothetical protein
MSSYLSFIQIPWAAGEIQLRLARKALDLLSQPEGWFIDDTSLQARLKRTSDPRLSPARRRMQSALIPSADAAPAALRGSKKQVKLAAFILCFPEGLQVRVLRVENIPALGHEQRKVEPFRKTLPERPVMVRCCLKGIDAFFEPGERFFEVHGASPFRVDRSW